MVAPKTAKATIDDETLLAALQERMERIARGGAPNSGRFCGYCFVRLNKGEDSCRSCGRSTAEVPPADSVPREVLLAYLAHWNKMRLWVNIFAFLGIFIAVVLAGLIVAFMPTVLKFLAIPMMLGGAWYFANLLGGGIGGHLGNRSGIAARARRWRSFQESRAAAPDRAPESR